MRDVVICIPGITGSVLQKEGRDIWNISGGALISALTTLGRDLARSFTSIHQLLPTYPCYIDGGGDPLSVDKADIPNLNRAKTKAALDFHREIAGAVDEHRKDSAYADGGYDLARIVGFKQPTQQSAIRDGDRVRLLSTIRDQDPGGDGTVSRPSATPLEYEDDQGATFSAERHASLQNDDHLLLQLAGVLTGNTISWAQFRKALPMVDRSLDVDDLYSVAESVRVKARPERETTGGLLAVAVDAQTGEEQARQRLGPGEDGWHEAELGPLPEGVYRLTAFGEGPVEPVTDLVTVLGD
jgi:hypothetical protein